MWLKVRHYPLYVLFSDGHPVRNVDYSYFYVSQVLLDTFHLHLVHLLRHHRVYHIQIVQNQNSRDHAKVRAVNNSEVL